MTTPKPTPCQWQPISTAPRDGGAILLFIPDGYSMCGLTDGIVIGHWCEDERSGGDPDADWYQLEQDGGFQLDISPTHWQPLPEPPK